MNKIVQKVAVISAAMVFGTLFAADDDGRLEETNAEDGAVSTQEQVEETLEKSKNENKLFYILPYCYRCEGNVEVLRMGASEWEPIVEGKFYALGTSFRVRGNQSRMILKFGQEAVVKVVGNGSFRANLQKLNEMKRGITLLGGQVKLSLARNFPEGAFVVSAPGFEVYDISGEARCSYSYTGDGDEARIRCVTGSAKIRGRHFNVLPMRAAQEVKIRTSQDCLYTGLYGESGDCLVKLAQGCVSEKDIDTDELKVVEKTLDWKLSPLTKIQIHRSVPDIGEKMSVAVMTFDANGNMHNRCVFCEDRAELNSGEIGPVREKEKEALKKKAAEMASSEENKESENASSEKSDESASEGSEE